MSDSSIDIHHLERAARYKVRRDFTDYYQNQFREGEILTFVELNFLPYHGGYTVVFRERKLYLQEEVNTKILDSFGEFFSPIPE